MEESEQQQGVLLYYKFATLPDPVATKEWFERSCSSLALLGRIRIAPGGINVTIGGSMKSLKSHIDAVSAQELFQGCDFKLAPCSKPADCNAAAGCGFDSLSVRLVEEIVTLGASPSPSLSNAGKHLSSQQFHQLLDKSGSGTVVLDARNIYETRIGKFSPPPGIEFLDPRIRQYSDLPAWIDDHVDQLRNRSVLMYCTGGVRCEMASAYIRSKGDEFKDVYQLSGGIQRYLEAFPDGGYFQGKNFVFDHRISVPSLHDKIVGICYRCKSPHDDYTPRLRCSLCRMLVLLCDKCKSSEPYLCELCAENQHSSQPAEASPAKSAGTKLRILCLHGFRQNASNLKGRLSSLAKKLRRTAEFSFVDAPHELPLLYQLHEDESQQEEPKIPPRKKFAWLIDPDGPKGSVQAWSPAQGAFDPMQYQKQTSGWDESRDHLRQVIAERGPFDGVLGFSQGAAVAAVLASLKDAGLVDIKFVILCSGFVSPVLGLEALIECPSLHIFGGRAGCDRQIDCGESESLATRFSPGSRTIVRHESGHIIPTRGEYLEQYLEFLKKFIYD